MVKRNGMLKLDTDYYKLIYNIENVEPLPKQTGKKEK